MISYISRISFLRGSFGHFVRLQKFSEETSLFWDEIQPFREANPDAIYIFDGTGMLYNCHHNPYTIQR